MFRAARCSKHVEEYSVTYILLKIKRIVHKVGVLKSLCYDARSEKHQIMLILMLRVTIKHYDKRD